MVTATIEMSDVVFSAVMQHFDRSTVDGLWYPRASGLPLVRIRLGARTYQMQRRRKHDTPWMTVVTLEHAEFDPESFDTWVENWSLVQA